MKFLTLLTSLMQPRRAARDLGGGGRGHWKSCVSPSLRQQDAARHPSVDPPDVIDADQQSLALSAHVAVLELHAVGHGLHPRRHLVHLCRLILLRTTVAAIRLLWRRSPTIAAILLRWWRPAISAAAVLAWWRAIVGHGHLRRRTPALRVLVVLALSSWVCHRAGLLDCGSVFRRVGERS